MGQGICSLLHNIGGVDWEDMANSGKMFKGEGADVGLLCVVGKNGMLELGNIPDKVHMDTEKATSETNGECLSCSYAIREQIL